MCEGGGGFWYTKKVIVIKSISVNKTCHRDRIANLTAPCPSHKKTYTLKLKHFTMAAATAARSSTIALPGLRPGQLKTAYIPKSHLAGWAGC